MGVLIADVNKLCFFNMLALHTMLKILVMEDTEDANKRHFIFPSTQADDHEIFRFCVGRGLKWILSGRCQ